MRPEPGGADAIDHGGNLVRARARFPDAPEPWIDLSTGISPFPYPYSAPSATAWTRLPEPELAGRLHEMAAAAYGAPAAANAVAAPGTQILLPFLYGAVAPGRAAVLGPTYAEHARVAALCGHEVAEIDSPEAVGAAQVVTVVNPNNPDGGIVPRDRLLRLATELRGRGGLLVVDEAFMDVGPDGASVAGDVDDLPIVVLRSFGKFHGLAGIRLGFAIAGARVAARLRSHLGPWAVSGPAAEIGLEALADSAWRAEQRARLAQAAAWLDAVLTGCGLDVAGGTDLFRLVRHQRAGDLHQRLAASGILVRPFDWNDRLLRIGLPADEEGYGRLDAALRLWSGN